MEDRVGREHGQEAKAQNSNSAEHLGDSRLKGAAIYARDRPKI